MNKRNKSIFVGLLLAAGTLLLMSCQELFSALNMQYFEIINNRGSMIEDVMWNEEFFGNIKNGESSGPITLESFVESSSAISFFQDGKSFKTVNKYRANSKVTLTANTEVVEITTPAAPSNLRAVRQSSTMLFLAWDDNSDNESGFSIESSATSESSGFVHIASVAADTSSYLFGLQELATDQTYWFRVKAYNSTGTSSYSNVVIPPPESIAPAAPSNLRTTKQSSTQFLLLWDDNSNNEYGFSIESSDISATTGFEEIATIAADTTVHSFFNNEFATEKTYWYRIRAYNSAGDSPYSNVSSFSFKETVPAAPSNLRAVKQSSTQYSLIWDDNSNNESGFVIERSAASASTDFIKLTTVAADTTYYSFSSIGIGTGKTYWFRIRAYNNAGNSPYSNVDTPPLEKETLAAPSNLRFTKHSSTGFILTWNDNSDNESGFFIERSTTSTSTGFVRFATAAANSTSYTVTNRELVTGQMYWYRVRAYNSTETSLYSNVISSLFKETLPAAPSNLRAAKQSSDKLILTWEDNSDNESGFSIESSPTSSSTGFVPFAKTAANSTSYVVDNRELATGQMYWYRVRAYNSAGNSPYSNTDSSPIEKIEPAAPSNLRVTKQTSSQLILDWNDNSNNEYGFSIERSSISASTGFEVITSVAANVSSYSYFSSKFATGEAYWYRVRAYNSAGNSPYSNVISSSFKETTPAAPGNLNADKKSITEYLLFWEDNSDNEDGFSIEESTLSASTGFVQIARVAANAVSYTVSTPELLEGKTYWFRVRAYNKAGDSSYSNVYAQTPETITPVAPSNLRVTRQASAGYSLTWEDNSYREYGFYIERSAVSASSGFVQIAMVPADSTNYPLSNSDLSTGIVYWYRVRAYNSAGTSPYSNISSNSFNDTIPDAPSNLHSTKPTSTQLVLEWEDNSDNEHGFYIETSAASDSSGFVQIALAAENATSYTFNGQDIATPQPNWYRVRAYNNTGTSSYSNVNRAPLEMTLPAAPGNLRVAKRTSTQIILKWDDNTDYEHGFFIEKSSISDSTGFSQIARIRADITEYSAVSHEFSTEETLWYRIRAHNNIGYSSYSNVVASALKGTVPAAPGNLRAIRQATTGYSLTWEDNSNNEDGFSIESSYVSESSGFVQIATAAANSRSYDLPSKELLAGKTYWFRIRAYNDAGSSSYSNVASPPPLEIPAAPSNLRVARQATTGYSLTWEDNSNNEDGFSIESSYVSESSGFVQIATAAANSRSYDLPSKELLAGKTYWFRIRAYNDAGSSSYSNVASPPPLEIPAAPSYLSADKQSITEYLLFWEDNSDNEDGFIIEKSTISESTDFVQIATVAANATTHPVSTPKLLEGKTYWFRVRAYNSAGHSSYSNVYAQKPETITPAAPSNLRVTKQTSAGYSLTWEDNSYREYGFYIERSAASASSGFVQIAMVPADSTNYPLSNSDLSTGIVYWYRVRAYNSAGTSPYSNISSNSFNDTIPDAPSNLHSTKPTSTQLVLEWEDNSDNEHGFYIETSAASDSSGFVQIALAAANATSHTLESPSFASSQQYWFRVRAYNNAGTSSYSNVNQSPLETTIPAAPGNLRVTKRTSTQLVLEWDDNSLNEHSFTIERSTVSATTGFSEFASTSVDTTKHSGFSPSYAAGETHWYRIRARNNVGYSPYSNVVASSLNGTGPDAPSNLRIARQSSTRYSLTWEDNSNNEDGFSIERSYVSESSGFVQITTVAANSRSYDFPSKELLAGKTYWFRIRAYNDAGSSSYSNVASPPPLEIPAAPSNLRAVRQALTGNSLTWEDNSNNEDGFSIERSYVSESSGFVQITTVAANSRSYDFSSKELLAGKTYWFRIRAYNDAGSSSYSNVAIYTPEILAAPSYLSAYKQSITQFLLSWDDNSDNEDGFSIEESITSESTGFVQIAAVAANANSYTVSTPKLLDGKTYWFRVRAYNSAGHSSYSNVYAQKPETIIPVAPSNLRVSKQTSAGYSLTWEDNSYREYGFYIERSATSASTGFVQIAALAADSTDYPLSNSELSTGKTYWFRIRAHNSAGTSPYSNISSNSLNDTSPSAPSNLHSTKPSSTQVVLIWEDASDNEYGFFIETSATSDSSGFVQIALAAANATSHTLESPSFASSRPYWFRVRSYNNAGTSSYSNVNQSPLETTIPAAPGNLRVTKRTSTQLVLEWDDNSIYEHSFTIERSTVSATTGFSEFASTSVDTTKHSGFSPSYATEETHWYRIRARNNVGYSSYSNVVASSIKNDDS